MFLKNTAKMGKIEVKEDKEVRNKKLELIQFLFTSSLSLTKDKQQKMPATYLSHYLYIPFGIMDPSNSQNSVKMTF